MDRQELLQSAIRKVGRGPTRRKTARGWDTPIVDTMTDDERWEVQQDFVDMVFPGRKRQKRSG